MKEEIMFVEKNGSGPPVVLVHGLGAYSFSWRHAVAALSKSHTTYAVDLLGFGQSPSPPGFASTMAAQGDAVIAQIKAEGIVDPILIGHSMGGGVALRVAEQSTKTGQPKLKKMILIAPVAYPPPRPLPGSNPELSRLLDVQALIRLCSAVNLSTGS
jgi:pimeloyl-ACP methyl ester carboxylesterase